MRRLLVRTVAVAVMMAGMAVMIAETAGTAAVPAVKSVNLVKSVKLVKSVPIVKLTKTQQKMRDLKRSTSRWIEVDLTKQRVIAWEGKRWVDAIIVSTGKPDTPTVTGVYDIYVKYREARMQGDDYDLADVPYVMYFSGGYGFHGAYWHSNFGTPVSHGCVNLAVDKAKWLYDFASVGTTVVVHR
jgi:lipoprotein-anchoring transpeptidase ErfK/SrfK